MKSPWLWGIVTLALALRLALAWSAGEQSICTPDSADYKSLMIQMAGQERFDSTFRTPGYPLFLVPLVYGWQYVLLVQIVLDCGLVVLTFLIGRKLVSHQAGLLGALLQAVSPLAIASSCRILSDSLYAFMLGVVMLLLMRHLSLLRQDIEQAKHALGHEGESKKSRVELSRATWKALIQSTIVLGAATYVRPIGMMMAVPIALVLLCGRRGLVRAGVFAVIFLACLSPWVARNIHTQNYYGFSSFASESFARYVALPMYRENKFSVPKLPPPGDRFSEMRYRKKTAADDAQEFDRYFARLNRTDRDDLVKEALKHPLLVAKYQLKGAPIFWLPDATDMLEVAGRTEGGRGTLRVLLDEGVMAAARNYLGPQPDDATTFMVLLTLTIYAVWLVGLAVFLAVSLRRLIKSRLRMPAEAWIIILLVLLSMLAPGPASHPRFRVPLEPYLCIASAAGYLALLARLTRRPPQELPIDD